VNKKLIVIIGFVSLLIIIIIVSSKRISKDNTTINPQFSSNITYCEKDSDCTTQETLKSKCCGNACPEIVNVYNKSNDEIDCNNVGCTDFYYVCPKHEVKCIDNQCTKIDLE